MSAFQVCGLELTLQYSLKMDEKFLSNTHNYETTRREHRGNASGYWNGQEVFWIKIPKS